MSAFAQRVVGLLGIILFQILVEVFDGGIAVASKDGLVCKQCAGWLMRDQIRVWIGLDMIDERAGVWRRGSIDRVLDGMGTDDGGLIASVHGLYLGSGLVVATWMGRWSCNEAGVAVVCMEGVVVWVVGVVLR
ncbi:hypothetical protein M0R45_025803 [Rubus argutus]|uniref:Uncharacterized protein n=1 Tax=Rubus argutus TaxID=59490 RepID=A0AAW1WZA7_RUBAR